MKITLALVFLLIGCCFPGAADEFKSCPPWEVTVVDEAGKPLANCTVLQEWGYTIFETSTNCVTNVVTDAAGRVTLPERRVSLTVAKSKLRRSMKRLSEPESAGHWSSLYVWKKGFEGVHVHARGDANVLYTAAGMKSRIVLRPKEPAR